MEKIRVLIMDNNVSAANELSAFLLSRPQIESAETAEDGMQAMELLHRKKYDVLLTDLLSPRLDGFGLLREVQKMESVPRVLVLTALQRDDFVQRAIQLGCDYYMLKPYDFENVYQRLTELFAEDGPKVLHLPEAQAIPSLDEKIADIFLSMGIPAHIKGYHFLREAIKLVIDDREKINAITKDLYPTVANHFHTTSSKVERAIRHAIDVAWNRGQMENLNKLFGAKFYVRHDKPTNGEFIALIADRLSIEISA